MQIIIFIKTAVEDNESLKFYLDLQLAIAASGDTLIRIMIPRVARITLYHFIVRVRVETRAVYIIIVITMLENLSGLLWLYLVLLTSNIFFSFSFKTTYTRWCLILGWCDPNNCLLAICGRAIANKLQLLLPLFCSWIKATDRQS